MFPHGWEKSKADPIKYRQRQVTEILLKSISITSKLRDSLYLKGGILLNLAYGSPRSTSDVDFTTLADPATYVAQLRLELDRGLQRAASQLGYTDLVCQVQTITEQPRTFPDARFPALRVTIGSAERGTNEERRLSEGQAPRTLQIDISFKEPVELVDQLVLDTSGQFSGYSLTEVLAEKLRALLQQKARKHQRSRRQDVYDIAYLIESFPLDDDERTELLRIFRVKSEARDITPTIDSLSDPEIAELAKAQWSSMQEELEDPLPSFEERFALVHAFYRSLPW